MHRRAGAAALMLAAACTTQLAAQNQATSFMTGVNPSDLRFTPITPPSLSKSFYSSGAFGGDPSNFSVTSLLPKVSMPNRNGFIPFPRYP